MHSLFRSQERKIKAELLARGPWVTDQQLPHSFLPGLASRPWHSALTHYPHIQNVVEALHEAYPALQAEYRALKDTGRLAPESECIHDAGSGAWMTFMSNGVWHKEVDARGCSVHTPVACGLLHSVSTLPGAGGADALFRPLRVGYSAVGGRAHLLPHHGLTNAQLKLHLGLIVPAKEGGAYTYKNAARAGSSGGGGGGGKSPCTRIRVGNETRSWTQGGVLFFDDSFEHEVWNDCERERVVLQLVFAHPDLAGSGLPNPFAGATGPSH